MQSGLARGGRHRAFTGGAIYWSPDTGAHHVLDGIVSTAWFVRGLEAGLLGYPTGDTV